jgi:exonuclease SbcC
LVQQWQAWQTQHSDLHAATLDAVLDMDNASVDALQQHCQDLLDQHKQAQNQWEWIQQQAAAHQQQQPSDCPADSATTQQALLTQQQRVEHVQQAWAVVFGQINEDQRRQQQAAQLGQALADAQREQARWHKLASPIGCATGAVFRKIAQGYQLDVLLAQANVQLEQLSRRYRLRRADDTLGLLVIDRDMGDECRSVHSLSGGESFLVSLALALGLASMASGLLKIESLFIDEGFGTLDPDSLQLVMDALDQLQAQGRKVIVITHVQDMQERIPVQIQVTRIGLGQSRICVTDRPMRL